MYMYTVRTVYKDPLSIAFKSQSERERYPLDPLKVISGSSRLDCLRLYCTLYCTQCTVFLVQ